MIDVIKPTLLLNKEKCLNNLNRINNLAQLNNINFRPHFKTHQSLEVGRWFKKFGVKSITVSSVSMAKYFSDEWDDILIAFPLNILELEEIKFLQDKIKLVGVQVILQFQVYQAKFLEFVDHSNRILILLIELI